MPRLTRHPRGASQNPQESSLRVLSFHTMSFLWSGAGCVRLSPPKAQRSLSHDLRQLAHLGIALAQPAGVIANLDDPAQLVQGTLTGFGGIAANTLQRLCNMLAQWQLLGSCRIHIAAVQPEATSLKTVIGI